MRLCLFASLREKYFSESNNLWINLKAFASGAAELSKERFRINAVVFPHRIVRDTGMSLNDSTLPACRYFKYTLGLTRCSKNIRPFSWSGVPVIHRRSQRTGKFCRILAGEAVATACAILNVDIPISAGAVWTTRVRSLAFKAPCCAIVDMDQAAARFVA